MTVGADGDSNLYDVVLDINRDSSRLLVNRVFMAQEIKPTANP